MSRQKKVNWSLNSQPSPKLPIDTAFCQQLVNTSVLSHLVLDLIYHLLQFGEHQFQLHLHILPHVRAWSCQLVTQLDDPCYSYFDFCMDHISSPKQQRNIVQLCTMELCATKMRERGFPQMFPWFLLKLSCRYVYYCQQSSSPFSNDTFQGDFQQMAYYC